MFSKKNIKFVIKLTMKRRVCMLKTTFKKSISENQINIINDNYDPDILNEGKSCKNSISL